MIPRDISRFVERPFSEKRRSFSFNLKPAKEKRSIRAMINPMAKGMIISRYPERWFLLTKVPVRESR